MMGIKALRKTCRHSTPRSATPFARAVITYCLRTSSSTEFFVRMVIIAKPPTTMAVTGNVMCQK